MELKEFISASLQQIIEGVEDAQKVAKDKGAIINPPTTRYKEEIDRVDSIKFDVAVTVTEGTASKGGAAISVGFVKLGADGKSNAETQSLSRIEFEVWVKLPTQQD